MKKIFVFLMVILLFSDLAMASSEMAARYAKLANSYRENGDFEKALEFAEKAIKQVKKGTYWNAAGNEMLALTYRDMALSGSYAGSEAYFLALAKEKAEIAIDIYNKVIKQEDGSPNPVSRLKESLENIAFYIDPNSNNAPVLNGNSSNNELKNGSNWSITGINANKNTLNFDNAKLKQLPPNISPSAKNISLANNRFQNIPPELLSIKGLEYLSLADNKLKNIDMISSQAFKNLKWLDCSGNRIKELPSGWANLQSLEILDLSNNRIKTLPADIVLCRNLKVLDITGNKIPYSQVLNLVRNMPNTNIISDRYELVEENEDEFED